ncbi:MAG: cell division protein FtsQ/DivIB [Solirubrobacteraceae bacterium]
MSTGSGPARRWWLRRRVSSVEFHVPNRHRRATRVLIAVVSAGLLGWLGWLWFQNSAFVRVRHVTVVGLSGPDVVRIRSQLTSAALAMTTLNMSAARLKAAVAAYPVVQAVSLQAHGAHSLTIRVVEQVPVAQIEEGGKTELVDASEQVLARSPLAHSSLPRLLLRAAPPASVISAPGARAAVAVLAAAPYRLLAHIQSATWSALHGVILQLRGGPQIYFGETAELALKWNAAVAVLQNATSQGAAYIDVSDPRRPAAGVGVSNQQAAALGLVSQLNTTG